ncbi:MAG: MoaD/ThiS family protein [Nanobdellota archaeon]
MNVIIERPKKTVSLQFTGEASDLLKKLDVASEDVLIIRNGELVTEDELLEDNDVIELLSVISGG